MVKKFKVSFEAETDDEGFTHAPHETTRQYAEGTDGWLIGTPINAEIIEVKPQFEAGWYQHKDSSSEEVGYWTLDNILDFGEEFAEYYRRMNPPTPYEEEYKDGYYHMADGFEYRREGGLWYLKLSTGWQSSGYSDEDIDSDYDIQWVHGL